MEQEERLSLQEQARAFDRQQAKKDLRNGSLLIGAFITLPLLLSSLLDGGTVFVALIPLVLGIFLCARGALGLARTGAALSPDEVASRAVEVAGMSGSALRGRIDVASQSNTSDSRTTFFVRKGPGGLMTVMNFMVTASPTDGGQTNVLLKVGDFLFQKGSLGMKLSINGSHVIGKYVSLLRGAL